MVAVYVPSSMSPLPQDNFFSGSNSGRRPYFEGPKNALCTPIRKTQASRIGMCFQISPVSASDITTTSKTLTPMEIVRLLKRSARKPPAIENRINGKENSALISSLMRCFSASDRFMATSMKRTRFFNALSLNAPWNCVTNRLQNPLSESGIRVLSDSFIFVDRTS